jgi:hypothetical protein
LLRRKNDQVNKGELARVATIALVPKHKKKLVNHF